MPLFQIVDVRKEERRALAMSFAYFFFLLTGYFILRPIRDEVAAASGVQQLPWLFGGTLTATLLFTPIYTRLVVRYAPRRFIVTTYHLFAVQLIAFYLMMRAWPPVDGTPAAIWTGRAFFVWTSVFNLFIVSIFWSYMADMFRSDQAKRLFGFIGVGGTLGSITGSAVTANLASRIGATNLLIVSTVLLEVAVLMVALFPAKSTVASIVPDATRARTAGVVADVVTDTHATSNDASASDMHGESKPVGGKVWSGVTDLLKSRYLLMICAFLILYTVGSTFLYFGQSDIVGTYYTTRDARTTVLGQIELSVQVFTVVVQLLFTGRIIKWFGLATTMALLPMLSMLGFGALAMFPVFATLAVFVVLRRGSNFALTNPAMEILFTVVPREEKYKAKNFIETFVYRGGDQIGAWVFKGLTSLGLSLRGISIVAVPLAAIWFAIGVWLGREHARRAAQATSSGAPDSR